MARGFDDMLPQYIAVERGELAMPIDDGRMVSGHAWLESNPSAGPYDRVFSGFGCGR
jgi:hypothetical protein